MTFIEYGFPQNSICIHEIEYGILFAHFKLSIRFPPFPARIGNLVFYISIPSSPWVPKSCNVKRCAWNHCYLTQTCSEKVELFRIVF